MGKIYTAITYDVCVHLSLFEEMNQYPITNVDKMTEEVAEYARLDVAPVVKVIESEFNNDSKLYKEYRFQKYECNCEQEKV